LRSVFEKFIEILNIGTMSVTRLERKTKRRRNEANQRRAVIKRLNAQPVIKNVDIEAIKKEFEAKKNEQN
jgi:hypothetical protein